ncbi:DUF4190 domain-containing protein [Actinomadura litoris]|uniref:DUF4190 domain-containing protein n=1 Tax=Actinomadura litoris TaxID=2678616 RepID=UPI001FA6F3E2|nr:DUF4190 domain-containing protein [Actinomadura litoris]
MITPPNDDPPSEEPPPHPAPAWAPVAPPPPADAAAPPPADAAVPPPVDATMPPPVGTTMPPPMPGAAQWPELEGHPYGTGLPPLDRPTSKLAITTIVTGVLGLVVLTVVFAIAALVRIRRTGERGRALVVGGLAAALSWVVVAAVFAAVLATMDVADPTAAGDAARVQPYPKVGECFDLPSGREVRDTAVIACDRPHEAEVVLAFDLPDGPWPGQAEVSETGRAGCDRHVRQRFHTRVPVEDGEVITLSPQRDAWPRDRTVRCAVAGPQTFRLTGPVSALGYQVRIWDELRTGDCFDKPKKGGETLRLIDCAKRHDAQLMDRFSLPRGRYPGTRAAERKARQGCMRRVLDRFREHRPRVPVDTWFGYPSPETWAAGNRVVVCYVTAAKGGSRLSESVVPPPARA